MFKYFLSRLIYFPSITFGLISAEIFPYGILYAAAFLKKLSISLVFLSFLFIFSIFYGAINYSEFNLFEVLRSTAAYLNPLLLFYVLMKNIEPSIIFMHIKFIKRLFYFLLALGALQASGAIGFLDPLLKFLVPRASAEALGLRGVTLISTEPARASIEFLFLFMLLNTIKKFKVGVTLFIIAYYALVFKSATGLILLALYLLLAHSVLMMTVIFSAVFLAPLVDQVLIEGRVLKLIWELSSLQPDEMLYLLVNTSGNRAISIYLAWHYALHNIFGGGLGYWMSSSVDALYASGIDYTKYNYFNYAMEHRGNYSFRSSGFISNFIFDFGLISLLVLFGFLTNTIIRSRYRKHLLIDKQTIAFFVIFLVNILFFGSVGVLAPWITLALLIRYKWERYGYRQ